MVEKSVKIMKIGLLIVIMLGIAIIVNLFIMNANKQGIICIQQPFFYGARELSARNDNASVSCSCVISDPDKVGFKTFTFDKENFRMERWFNYEAQKE